MKKPLTKPIDPNAMLTPAQAAKWLQLTPRDLSLKTTAGIVSAFRLGRKTVRYHVQTVINEFKRGNLS